MTEERSEAAEQDAKASTLMSKKVLTRWGIAAVVLLLISSGVGWFLRDFRATESEPPPPALPSCVDILSVASAGPADDGLAMYDEPLTVTAPEEPVQQRCRFEGGDATTTKIVVLLDAQFLHTPEWAVLRLDQSSCPDTVTATPDEAGRQVVSCVPPNYDPAKVDAVRDVAAGRLWLSVETRFQYLDSSSTVDAADEARTVELTRAIADAVVGLVAV